MIIKKLFVIGILILSTISALASDSISVRKIKKERMITIMGRVCDSFTKVGIPSAFVTLMLEDSSVVDTVHVEAWDAMTNKKDVFFQLRIPARPRKYVIKVVHPDYNDTYVNYDLKYIARNKYIEMPVVSMHRKNKKKELNVMLDEVVVKATKIKMVYKGDTLVFNADAFNLPHGSMLDDLIRQLPGVQLKENGEITVNGRKIDYLTLNGKDFFKGNNKVMLDNLPYFTVKNIQIYNKDTEKNKYLDRISEKKDYVMDVQLKREYARGCLVNIEGAVGSSDRYMSRLFGLRFTDNSRLSLFGNLNNVNENSTPNSDGDWDPSNVSQGLQRVKNIGANVYVDDKDKRYRESLDAQMSWNNADNESRTASQTYLSSGNTFSHSRSVSNQCAYSFTASNSMEWLKSFYISSITSISYNSSDDASISSSALFNKDPSVYGGTNEVLDSVFSKLINPSLKSLTVNRNCSHRLDDSHDLVLQQGVNYVQKLPWGDNIDGNFNFNYRDYSARQFGLSRVDYLQNSLTSDKRNQFEDSHSRSYDYHAGLTYNVHLLSDWSFALGYLYRQNWGMDDKPMYRLDRLAEWNDDSYHPFGTLPQTRDSLLLGLDTGNSSYSSKFGRNHIVNVQFRYARQRDGGGYTFFRFTLPLSYKSENTHYTRGVTDTSFFQRNWLFQPEVMGYLMSNRQQFYFGYRESVTTPTTLNLVQVRDDSNPLVVRYGNPNLRNSHTHSLNGGITLNVPKYERSYSVTANVGIVRNQIVDGYTYNTSTGVYTYTPENVNGNWNVGVDLNYQSAIDSMKLFTWSVSMEHNYSHHVYLAADDGAAEAVRCTAKSFSNTDRLSFKYQKDELMLGLDGKFSWQHSGSGTSGVASSDVYTYNYGFTGQYKFPWQLQLVTSLCMYSRRGMSDRSMNTDNLEWNASLSRSFVKGKVVCKFEGFDILHQLAQIQYNVSSNGTLSVWNNCIPSYFMLHFIYRINLIPSKTT